ncbi:hypothetical protein T11_13341 [Trichinella zimbabwensis]|uniref:Uncharacterized protein n=1 Tax=Trichinella zimbabwensis TaxID=268475 RepID=A0A0V1HCI6_9BILA|nr:hypothetical protein T11_13341 [Trichinella zimbabwensis]
MLAFQQRKDVECVLSDSQNNTSDVKKVAGAEIGSLLLNSMRVTAGQLSNLPLKLCRALAFSNVNVERSQNSKYYFFLFLWSPPEHRLKHRSAGQSGQAFLLPRAKQQFSIFTEIENQNIVQNFFLVNSPSPVEGVTIKDSHKSWHAGKNNAQPSISSRSKCSASLEKPSFSINWRT